LKRKFENNEDSQITSPPGRSSSIVASQKSTTAESTPYFNSQSLTQQRTPEINPFFNKDYNTQPTAQARRAFTVGDRESSVSRDKSPLAQSNLRSDSFDRFSLARNKSPNTGTKSIPKPSFNLSSPLNSNLFQLQRPSTPTRQIRLQINRPSIFSNSSDTSFKEITTV